MDQLPLCVDCDGTLLQSDLLQESFLLALRQRFWSACLAVLRLPFRGKAALKLELAREIDLDVSTLPYDQRVLDHVRAQRALGRRTVLVTAAARPLAERVAAHLQLFDEVLATDSASFNLSAGNKAECLVRRFGAQGFEYIGNSGDDLAVWREAGIVSIANAKSQVLVRARALGRTGIEFERPAAKGVPLLKACRPHQWLKNLLVLVPLLAAHQIGTAGLLGQALLAFAAFSACASSVYLLNDLLDLQSDRRHPRKRIRPFASGAVPISTGLALAPLLLLVSIAIARMLPLLFGLTLLIYFLTTLAYSFRLKAQVMVDVMLLAALYTLRVLAGGAAVNVAPSFWLLAFSLFIFLSLALVKRYAEMNALAWRNEDRASGRGYVVPDRAVLLAVGVASGYNSLMVLALYLNSADVLRLYATPQILWLIVPLMAYWVARIWLKTHRGEMHDDPVVFAARDWQSLLIGLLILGSALLATLPLGLPSA